MQHIRNYINGELVAPAGKQYIDNYNPATGKVYSLIPDSDERDVELATQAALQAFPSWSNTPKDERSRILLKVSELIEKNLERLAIAESVDNGKPVVSEYGLLMEAAPEAEARRVAAWKHQVTPAAMNAPDEEQLLQQHGGRGRRVSVDRLDIHGDTTPPAL